MRVAKVEPSVEFYVSVDLTDEHPLINENGYRYTPDTVVVKFQGPTAAAAAACQIPFVDVTRGHRVKADGTAGAPVGRSHFLFRSQNPEFYDRLVEAARNAIGEHIAAAEATEDDGLTLIAGVLYDQDGYEAEGQDEQ